MALNKNAVHERAREVGRCANCNFDRGEQRARETAGGLAGVWWCTICNRVAFGGSSFFKLTDEQKLTLPRTDARKESCWVCQKVAVLETHHLAPRAFFGDECDEWPIVRVCNECHRKWEDRMGTHARNSNR
jgi:hypothetical protein